MVGQLALVNDKHEIIEAIADLEQQKKAIEAAEKDMRAQLLQACEDYNVVGFTTELIDVTYVPAHERESFDGAAFAADYPELAPLYKKTSKVKAMIRIKVKEENK